jgi:UPF0042 nucleotide-binding protein
MTTTPSSGNAASSRKPTVVVVTGLSGAGRSTALRTLEDLGFFCIDNLPTVLAPEAVALCERGGMLRVALGIDVRVRTFLGEVGNVLARLESGGERVLHVVFLDASDEIILHRYGETRRPHALASDADDEIGRAASVLEGVQLERERLAPLRARATRVIDTTRLSVHDLRRAVIAHFGPAAGDTPGMLVRVVSFGFKYGAPVDADLVFDVRFLENPYFRPELKNLSGTDAEVASFVSALPETEQFLAKTLDLLSFVVPKYEREGKSYLTIGIGCTGGRHRSVVIAEKIAQRLGVPALVIHRDVARGGPRHPSTAPPPFEQDPSVVRELQAGLSPLPSLASTSQAMPGTAPQGPQSTRGGGRR